MAAWRRHAACEVAPGRPVVRLQEATLGHGGRTIWEGLNLAVSPGEFLAVLGPNGAGKTSLLKVLLGLFPLTAGTVEVHGQPPHRGRGCVGYVPQQRAFDPDLPIRGRDLVEFGLDGHRFGLPIMTAGKRRRIDGALRSVRATGYADAPVGRLSGGEQQRLRIAQALLTNPALLLCDEPLSSLDLSHQREVSSLIDERRRQAGTAVIFVTHEINPVLPYVDRVLYLVAGRWAVGTPQAIMTTGRLSDLYGTPVEVVEVGGRIVVVSAEEIAGEPLEQGHHIGSPAEREQVGG
ncbi:MAG: ABC transporter ATP-binding protein [Thermoleophilia bacterium]|nr:ABC transporter ATP-binding protein [Thermoleophilia bacterium]